MVSRSACVVVQFIMAMSYARSLVYQYIQFNVPIALLLSELDLRVLVVRWKDRRGAGFSSVYQGVGPRPQAGMNTTYIPHYA